MKLTCLLFAIAVITITAGQTLNMNFPVSFMKRELRILEAMWKKDLSLSTRPAYLVWFEELVIRVVYKEGFVKAEGNYGVTLRNGHVNSDGLHFKDGALLFLDDYDGETPLHDDASLAYTYDYSVPIKVLHTDIKLHYFGLDTLQTAINNFVPEDECDSGALKILISKAEMMIPGGIEEIPEDKNNISKYTRQGENFLFTGHFWFIHIERDLSEVDDPTWIFKDVFPVKSFQYQHISSQLNGEFKILNSDKELHLTKHSKYAFREFRLCNVDVDDGSSTPKLSGRQLT